MICFFFHLLRDLLLYYELTISILYANNVGFQDNHITLIAGQMKGLRLLVLQAQCEIFVQPPNTAVGLFKILWNILASIMFNTLLSRVRGYLQYSSYFTESQFSASPNKNRKLLPSFLEMSELPPLSTTVESTWWRKGNTYFSVRTTWSAICAHKFSEGHPSFITQPIDKLLLAGVILISVSQRYC